MSKNEITSHHIYGSDIQQIVAKIKELSILLEEKAEELGLENKNALRANPEILKIWRRICVLHMRGLVICDESGYSDVACMYIREPQACERVLGVPREETCCGRFFGLE
jgi:hypothetical protein